MLFKFELFTSIWYSCCPDDPVTIDLTNILSKPNVLSIKKILTKPIKYSGKKIRNENIANDKSSNKLEMFL